MLKICSVTFLQALNPACSSAMISALGEPIHGDFFLHGFARMTNEADGSVVLTSQGQASALALLAF